MKTVVQTPKLIGFFSEKACRMVSYRYINLRGTTTDRDRLNFFPNVISTLPQTIVSVE